MREASSVGPQLTQLLCWAGPVIVQVFFFSGLRSCLRGGRSHPPPHVGFTSMLVSCVIWVLYGVATDNPSVWLPNVPGVAVGAAATLHIHSVRPLPARVLAAMAVAIAAVLTLQFGGVMEKDAADTWTGVCGNAACVVMLCSGAAAWPRIVRERDARCVDVWMTAAGLCNSVAWGAFGLLVAHDWLIVGANVFGIASQVVSFALVAAYPAPRRQLLPLPPYLASSGRCSIPPPSPDAGPALAGCTPLILYLRHCVRPPANHATL